MMETAAGTVYFMCPLLPPGHLAIDEANTGRVRSRDLPVLPDC
jgi:hypothetical protein